MYAGLQTGEPVAVANKRRSAARLIDNADIRDDFEHGTNVPPRLTSVYTIGEISPEGVDGPRLCYYSHCVGYWREIVCTTASAHAGPKTARGHRRRDSILEQIQTCNGDVYGRLVLCVGRSCPQPSPSYFGFMHQFGIDSNNRVAVLFDARFRSGYDPVGQAQFPWLLCRVSSRQHL